MVFIIARVTIIIRKKLDIFFLTIDIENFMKKIIKSYFNIYYIKFFYLLQQDIKLNKNIYNISVLTNVFMNLYDNSNIDCNKKNRNKLYDLYNNIVLNKFAHSNKYKSNFLFGNYKQVRSSVVVRSKELVFSCIIK